MSFDKCFLRQSYVKALKITNKFTVMWAVGVEGVMNEDDADCWMR
jgi:hypothetical protein